MKKIAAILLAIIVATCAMFSTVASAADVAESANDFGFGFIVKNDSVTVDVKNKLIYGFEGVNEGVLTKDILLANIDANSELGFTLDADDYIGTGSVITLSNGANDTEFKVILVGDLNGDGVFDVLDAATAQKLSTDKDVDFGADAEIFVKAADLNEDGAIDANDYAAQVNGVAAEAIDQPADGTDTKIEFEEIGTQPYTGVEVTPEGEVVINFDGGSLDLGTDFEVVNYTENIELGIATMVVKGTGAFAGTQTLTFEIVGLLQDIANEMDTVAVDAGLERLVSVDYDSVAKNFAVTVNATELLSGNIDGNMAALNGLLTKMDAYRAENLQGIDLTVGDYEVAVDGAVNRGELKGLVFDFAKGFFADFANSADNIAKAYSAVLVEPIVSNNEVVDAQTNFGVKLEVVGAQSDIDTLKNVSGKLSRYMGFSVVDGNAVIDITMPAGFATKVVDVLSEGTGDVAAAKELFDSLTVGDILNLATLVSVEDISASSADEINRALGLAMQLVGVANKVLDEVTVANVTDMNGKTVALLNGKDFVVDYENLDRIEALVEGVIGILSDDVLGANINTFANGDIYTAAFDVALAYKNISETIIVNVDLFGAVETPTIIEETAEYFSGIIADLGLSNVASVSYDKDACRAVAALNAREFATNLTFDENAIDGLYTEIKGYFDDNYGTSTIVVGGYEIVTAGAINKSALKSFIFSAAAGFFEDASNIGADNVLRSFNTVVTEADGTTHAFDLDFALEGSEADIARVEKIAAKVADYVSFEVVNGNAVVNVGLPAGMRNTIIETFGEGDAQAAKDLLDSLTIEEAFMVLAHMDADHISVSSAKEIEAIVDLICGFDAVINKALSKVSASTTVNGVAYDVLADNVVFDLEGASSIAALVEEVAAAINPDLKGLTVADFANEDGTYTLAVDATVSIGGIKETVVLNLDVFGDIEKENAIEDTVDYVDGILADLGLSNMASVTFEDGKAVAAFNASEFIANGFNFDENSFDGLYTEIRGYFDDNFSDSTIKVGDFELVTDGKINKAAVKDFIFDFATGFFTDVANMDVATLRSYSTVVTDAEGNKEVFAFDFNLEGTEAHIEKVKELSAKVAAHVSFEEVDGNAAVSVNLPVGMKNTIVEYFGEGDKVAAVELFNSLTVDEAFMILAHMDAEHISASSAADIDRIIGIICDVSVLANKVLSKVDNASVNVNGVDYDLLADGAKFELETKNVKGLVEATQNMLGAVKSLHLSDFQNEDGTYTLVVNAGTTIGDINETFTINVAVF